MTASPTLRRFPPGPAVAAVDVKGHGRISPRPVLSGLIALCLVSAALMLAADATWQGAGPAQASLAVLAALALGVGLREDRDLHWNAAGIEGPASMLSLSAPRFIAWDAIAAGGPDGFGGGFVADDEGTVIRWNAAYAGSAALRAELARAGLPLVAPRPLAG